MSKQRVNLTIPLDLEADKEIITWLASLKVPKSVVGRNALYAYKKSLQASDSRAEDSILLDSFDNEPVDIEGDF